MSPRKRLLLCPLTAARTNVKTLSFVVSRLFSAVRPEDAGRAAVPKLSTQAENGALFVQGKAAQKWFNELSAFPLRMTQRRIVAEPTRSPANQLSQTSLM